jgi:hypothetical protein
LMMTWGAARKEKKTKTEARRVASTLWKPLIVHPETERFLFANAIGSQSRPTTKQRGSCAPSLGHDGILLKRGCPTLSLHFWAVVDTTRAHPDVKGGVRRGVALLNRAHVLVQYKILSGEPVDI